MSFVQVGFTDAAGELQVLEEDELWEDREISHIFRPVSAAPLHR